MVPWIYLCYSVLRAEARKGYSHDNEAAGPLAHRKAMQLFLLSERVPTIIKDGSKAFLSAGETDTRHIYINVLRDLGEEKSQNTALWSSSHHPTLSC